MQSPSAVILEPRKIKSDTVSTVSPSISHEVMGPDAMIFIFWMLSFKPTFSPSSFTFIKRLFSSSSLSAIRVVSSAYLRLLIFLLAIIKVDEVIIRFRLLDFYWLFTRYGRKIIAKMLLSYFSPYMHTYNCLLIHNTEIIMNLIWHCAWMG